MKTRTTLNSVLIVAIIGYGISIRIIGDLFLFIVFFPLTILFAIFFCIINIRNKNTLYTVLGCIVFLFTGGWMINHYCLPGPFHPISLSADIGIVIFTVFLGWSFRKPHKKRIVLSIGTTSFMLFLVVLMVVASITHSPSESSSIDALKTVPYLSYVVEEKAMNKDGVITYNQDLCNSGINIYTFLDASKGAAYLMDMSGNRLHTWSPKRSLSEWLHVKMYNKSDLLVIRRGIMLMRLDWDSHIRWEKNIPIHHDIAIAENSDIYTLIQTPDTLLKFYS